MRDETEIQAELDAAQADLESKVSQLKDVLEAKIETPKKVVNGTRDLLSVAMDKKWEILGAIAVVWLVSSVIRDLRD